MFARFNNSVSLRKFSAALVAVTALVMTGCGDVYVHEEFDKLTMNKSDAEVTTAIGKPTAVDANDPKHVVWTYYSKTFDVENQNKRDIKVTLILEPDATTSHLKVVKVEYQKS